VVMRASFHTSRLDAVLQCVSSVSICKRRGERLCCVTVHWYMQTEACRLWCNPIEVIATAHYTNGTISCSTIRVQSVSLKLTNMPPRKFLVQIEDDLVTVPCSMRG